MHLGVICSRLSQHIHDVAARIGLSPIPFVYHDRHLHAFLGFLRQRGEIYLDVVRHHPGLHQHPRLRPDGVQYSHERLFAALHNLDNLSLTPLALGIPAFSRRLLSGYGDFNYIAVQCTPCLGSLHEHIIVWLFRHLDERIAFPRHAHRALNHRIFIVTASPAVTELSVTAFFQSLPAVFSSMTALVFFSHKLFCYP